MLLAIDVGNTHTVLGVWNEDDLVAHWRVTTRIDRTADELGVLMRSLFESTLRNAIVFLHLRGNRALLST